MNIPISPAAQGSGTRHPAVLAWLRLVRVFQRIERLSGEGLRCHDLSAAQFDVLAHVGATTGPTQQELADSLLVTKGNICQLLDRMERSSLLERRQDGRANRLYLTGKGQECFEEAVPRHEERIASLFTGLTREEQVELLRLLRKLERSLS